MSQNNNPSNPSDNDPVNPINTDETPEATQPVPNDVGPITTGEAATEAPAAVPVPQADESTVGTGTSMALGCIAGTLVLIVFGLLFLALSTLL